MSEYLKKECPVCKEMVSEFPPAWKRHANKHSGATTEEPKAEPMEPTKKPEQKKKYDPKRPEDQKLLEQALAAQSEMLKAPQSFVSHLSSDEHMALRKIYAPETIGSNAKFSAYFGDVREKRFDVAKGYVPVFNEHGELVTNHGGDIMYTIPNVIRDPRIRAAELESEARLRQVTEMAAKRNTTGGKVPQADTDKLKEEVLTVERNSE